MISKVLSSCSIFEDSQGHW